MMYNMLESVSIKGQMERILNLIANSHFMQGIYEKKMIEFGLSGV